MLRTARSSTSSWARINNNQTGGVECAALTFGAEGIQMAIRIQVEIDGEATDGDVQVEFVRDGEPQGLTFENYRDLHRAPDRFFDSLPIVTQQEFNGEFWAEGFRATEKALATLKLKQFG